MKYKKCTTDIELYAAMINLKGCNDSGIGLDIAETPNNLERFVGRMTNVLMEQFLSAKVQLDFNASHARIFIRQHLSYFKILFKNVECIRIVNPKTKETSYQINDKIMGDIYLTILELFEPYLPVYSYNHLVPCDQTDSKPRITMVSDTITPIFSANINGVKSYHQTILDFQEGDHNSEVKNLDYVIFSSYMEEDYASIFKNLCNSN